MSFNHQQIEKKWQNYWLKNKTFACDTSDFSKPKYYVLDMFPYPSGNGLHVGHPEGYTATDIIARMKRMQGYNVLHPMGWDAFGLPAEQFAIQTGHHRATFQRKISIISVSRSKHLVFLMTGIEKYQLQIHLIINGHNGYFIQLYNKGLAYVDEIPVNWCPKLGTVLANEEVIDGKSERGGYPVIRKPMRQWRIAYYRICRTFIKRSRTL